MQSYMEKSVEILKQMVTLLPSEIRKNRSKTKCLLFVMTLIVQRLSVENLDISSLKCFPENCDLKLYEGKKQIIFKGHSSQLTKQIIISPSIGSCHVPKHHLKKFRYQDERENCKCYIEDSDI